MSDSNKTNDFSNEIETNKNKNNVHCQFCDSKILNPMSATYVTHEFNLPLMHQKTKEICAQIEAETLTDYWTVNDMFTFENIGFSNTVDNTKYLICADCEMGPVGYHDITTKLCYIALSRVKHVVE